VSKTPTKARTSTSKRASTKAKVAAAQKRQKGRASSSGAERKPSDNYRSLAADNPWLVVGAGLLGGALIASLLPKGTAKRLGQSAMAAAAVSGELASAFAKQTREAAHDGLGALEDLGGTVSENAAHLAGKAGKLSGEVAEKAGEAADRARSGGMALLQEAIKLATRIRH
jgi:hypothetical protein